MGSIPVRGSKKLFFRVGITRFILLYHHNLIVKGATSRYFESFAKEVRINRKGKKLEEFRLNFSRCTNRDVAPLIKRDLLHCFKRRSGCRWNWGLHGATSATRC